MSELAINGGTKVRSEPFPAQERMNPRAVAAVNDVLSGGCLTGYQGNWKNFRGGPEVSALEDEFARFVGAKLGRADFSKANLYGADFTDADLTHASFMRANLATARFDGARTEDANFKDARGLK